MQSKIKIELYNDHFENAKRYGIPHAQLIIADIPYNLGNNAYASNPMWYVDGDNKNGESKLAGKNIPYHARIAAIADAFDAMTSKRPYRDEIPLEKVKEEFRNLLGIQFDPEIGKVFLDILDNDYNEIMRIQSKYYSQL